MRGLSWKIGRVAGIDLFLHPSFLLLPAWGLMVGGTDYVVMIVAVFACVVLHELGHALTARSFGISTHDITLYPIGGVARLERMPKAPGAELLIALAGPLVNVALAGGFALILSLSNGLGSLGGFSYLREFTAELLMINLLLAAFNMVPAFPMDGGRVLRAALTGPLGRFRATEIAVSIGRAIAILFGVYALLTFSPMQVVLAGFVYFASGAELAQVRYEEHRRRFGSSEEGVWTAPRGYHWVDRGNGFWQLAPIHVNSRV